MDLHLRWIIFLYFPTGDDNLWWWSALELDLKFKAFSNSFECFLILLFHRERELNIYFSLIINRINFWQAWIFAICCLKKRAIVLFLRIILLFHNYHEFECLLWRSFDCCIEKNERNSVVSHEIICHRMECEGVVCETRENTRFFQLNDEFQIWNLQVFQKWLERIISFVFCINNNLL